MKTVYQQGVPLNTIILIFLVTSIYISVLCNPLSSLNTTLTSLLNSDNLTAIREAMRPILNNEDIFLNITQLFTKYGFPSEEHTIETSDGYLLKVFRMYNNTGPPVFIMHGFLLSSDDWLTIGPQAGLAYLLWLAGFDVWIGNARGNKHCKRHVSLSPHSAAFWDFSWDEIGRYDMAAMIDYTLDTTNKKQLKLIGYSQGTTASFVLLSEKPEYNAKISVYIALAPVAWCSNTETFIKALYEPINVVAVGRELGINTILTDTEFFETVTAVACGTPDLALAICYPILSTFFGEDFEQINKTSLPIIYGHMPAGVSAKQQEHYGQLTISGKFRLFDYGPAENIVRYGSAIPPDYPVQKITTKVVIMRADNDKVSAPQDAQTLIDKLPNIIKIYTVPFTNFCHSDYVYGRDVKALVYDKVMEILKDN